MRASAVWPTLGGMRVALLLFEHVDLLDVGGPYEVFLTANRLAERNRREAPFELAIVTDTDEPVRSYGGMLVGPTARLSEAVGSEIVVVPGAVDIEAVSANPAVRAAVTSLTAASSISSSVCTGAFLLADAGLLTGRPFTTHWEDLSDLAERLGRPDDARPGPWVDSGAVVTSGGLASGLAMALHLVDRLLGRPTATAVARQIDYTWDPSAGTDEEAAMQPRGLS